MENLKPQDAENFGILVQAMIGPDDSIGEESFDFVVCTIDFIKPILASQGHLFGKDYLFVQHYEYDLIWKVIESLCSEISGSDWSEIGNKLTRYGKWEFEDYRDGQGNS